MRAPVSLPLALIYRRSGARAVQPKAIAALSASMKAIGLKMPIEVRPCQKIRDGQPADAYEIIAGQHRFEAARSLAWENIDAFVSDDDAQRQRLWEIDENLQRNEGTAAERAKWHAEREAILVDLGLVLRGPGQPKNSDKLSEKASYARQTAANLGMDERTIRRDLSRGKHIDPLILAEVEGSDLDKGAVLDELARTPRENQAQRLSELRLERSRVRMADESLNDLEATEKQLAALMSAWNRAGAEARRKFLERVDTPVFDRGVA